MIQLMDIVRTWWQSKANKTTTIDLPRCFLNKLPCQVLSESGQESNEQKFINLRQAGKTLDEYIQGVYSSKSISAYMIAIEADHVHGFQQGLRLYIEKFLVIFQLDTYDEVINASRDVQQVVNKEKMISHLHLRGQPVKCQDELYLGILKSTKSLIYNRRLFADIVRSRHIPLRNANILTTYVYYVDQVSIVLGIVHRGGIQDQCFTLQYINNKKKRRRIRMVSKIDNQNRQPLPSQSKLYKQAKKNKVMDHSHGLVYNLTAEQVKKSDNMVQVRFQFVI